MASGLCHQCGPKGSKLKDLKDIKKVKMFVEEQVCSRAPGSCGPAAADVHTHKVLVYLCAPCARELGYAK